ncbi:hypothetical protein GCM10010403_00430 [Glycomyces rutgersensis]|uniref:Uncharacterized protein n=1 Tax=Glycomyces rutgersensis TaxID=58115 RepID=A0ABN3F5G8_9ACTN
MGEDFTLSATERPGADLRPDCRGQASVGADFNPSATERRELVPGADAEASRLPVRGGPWIHRSSTASP